jgi:hypothetical protein
MSIAKLIKLMPKCEKTNKTLHSIRAHISTKNNENFYAPFYYCPDCNTYKKMFKETNETFKNLESISLDYINSISKKKYQKQDIKVEKL